MRYWCVTVAVAVAVVAAWWVSPGAGPAHADTAGLTGDGYGVLVGSADAPVQLEIFCEPQCPHCAEFEADSGPGIGRHLGSGTLAVTYRWLTVLDERKHNDVSARIAAALVAAADPATPAPAYQAFVADLYGHQDRGGNGPAPTDIAAMAAESGVPDSVVGRIAAGAPEVDVAAMNTANLDRLKQVRPEPRTPTVYDLNAGSLVETAQDPGWLDRLAVP